jgi:excisionase family DNA binding protein
VVDSPAWLSTNDAAKALGITLRTVYRLIDDGELPAYRIGRVIRVKQADVDAFLLPTVQVLPFPLDVPFPTQVDGVPLVNYIDWLKTCYWISASGHPAVSVPCGRARDGGSAPLPVGLQVVGRWNGDASLLDVAEGIETVLGPLNAG